MYLRQAREEVGKSQKECAEFVSVTQKTMSQWEMGKSPPPCDAVIKLADFLGTTVTKICFGDDPCLFLSQLKHITFGDAKKILEALDLLAEENMEEYQDYLNTCKDLWWQFKS